MKKVTFIRHAQSKFNAGQIRDKSELKDCLLSDAGLEQAKTLKGCFDLLILTPLKRSMQTYVYSLVTCDKIIICDFFREHRDASGDLNFFGNEVPFNESKEDLYKRIDEGIQFLKDQEYQNIGIISHSHFIWHLMNRLGKNPTLIPNCTSLEIEF